MTAEDALALVTEVQRTRPGVARCARLVCIAVRVDAALLRRMRLRFAPELDVGVEADLWFSPLVESHGPTGFVLEKEVAALLRQNLAQEPALLQQVEQAMQEERDAIQPSISMEERITALALRGAPAAEIEQALRPAILAMADEQRATDVARWAMRALPRFPPEVLNTEAAMMLMLGASARLGDRPILENTDFETALSPETAWTLPKERLSDRVRIGVRLLPEGVQFSQLQGATETGIEVPRTQPLWISLSWMTGGQSFSRTVHVEPARVVPLPADLSDLTLQTLAGDKYRVEFIGPGAGVEEEGIPPAWLLKIFLSSTFRDLAEYRSAAGEMLRSLGHDILGSDDDAASGEPPFETSLKNVEICDVFVAIIGWTYGYIPPDKDSNPAGRSVSELEYEHAKKLGKPLLIFMADSTVPVPQDRLSVSEQPERLDAFRRRLEQEHIVARFESPADLAAQVGVAISNFQRRVIERGLVKVTIGNESRTGWLAEPDVVVTCGSNLPANEDEEFRQHQVPIIQGGRTGIATPVAWIRATGLLVLRLQEPFQEAKALPLTPPESRFEPDDYLTIASWVTDRVQVIAARRVQGSDGETLLNLSWSVSPGKASSLVGGVVIWKGFAAGTVGQLSENPEIARVTHVPFTDIAQVTQLLEQATSLENLASVKKAKPTLPLKLFISFAHADRILRDELAKHLKGFERMNLIEVLYDGEIFPGSAWDDETRRQLQSASIILLLISADFLTSGYLLEKEMEGVLARRLTRSALVIPLILRPCNWSGTPWSAFQSLPSDAKPVTMWEDQDEAWTDVARGIRLAVEHFAGQATPRIASLEPEEATAESAESRTVEQATNFEHDTRVEEVRLTHPLKLFISYAHEDAILRDELATHLQVLVRMNLVDSFYDRKISASTSWDDEIQHQLENASIILLLISADFLASNYIWSKEMQVALERHQTGAARVIPIILRSVDWKFAPFASMQVLPSEGKAVASWKDRDEAWTDVMRGIRLAIERMARQTAPETPPVAPATSESATEALEALKTLIHSNPEFDEAVERTSRVFTTAIQQIELLVNLIDIHDGLHGVRFQCYNYIRQEIQKDPATIDWRIVTQVEPTLARELQQLRSVLKGVSPDVFNTARIDELAGAHRELRSAIENQSAEQLKKSTTLINRVLELEPSRIEMQITHTARTLPIATLESTVRNVMVHLEPPQIASPAGKGFGQVLQALSKFNEDLGTLVSEYEQWSPLEAEFQRLEHTFQEDASDLEFSWPILKQRLDRLTTAETVWARSIRSKSERLDDAVKARSATRMRLAFKSVYAEAGTRFYQVNIGLKRVSEELREMLGTMVRIMPAA